MFQALKRLFSNLSSKNVDIRQMRIWRRRIVEDPRFHNRCDGGWEDANNKQTMMLLTAIDTAQLWANDNINYQFKVTNKDGGLVKCDEAPDGIFRRVY